MTGRPFSGYLSVLDGTRTDNILRTRLPMEYQSFRGCDTFSRIRDSDVKGAFTGREVMMKYIGLVYTIKSKLPFGDESRAKIVAEEASTIYVQMHSFRGFDSRKRSLDALQRDSRGVLEIVIKRRE